MQNALIYITTDKNMTKHNLKNTLLQRRLGMFNF